MKKALLIYSTTDGHTLKIARIIMGHLSPHPVDMIDINAPPKKIRQYALVIIGASIRYGKHHKQVYHFIQQYHQELSACQSVFFSVNLVARKPGKDSPESNPYVKKFLRQIPWTPDRVAVFAGKLHYALYSPADRWMIRFIMWLTHGPTDLNTCEEFTNCAKVDDFSCDLKRMLE